MGLDSSVTDGAVMVDHLSCIEGTGNTEGEVISLSMFLNLLEATEK